MSIFDNISNVLRGKKAPDAAVLAGLLAQAGADLADARKRLVDFETGLPEALIAGRRAEHRAAIDAARADVNDIETIVASVQQRLAETQHAEAEAARRAAYGEADRAARMAAKKLVDRYEALSREIVDLISEVAEADLKVAEANANLPAGADALLETEARVRDLPGSPYKILTEKTVPLWATPNSATPLPEEQQRIVELTREEGVGVVHLGAPKGQSGFHDTKRVFLREFRKIEFLDSTSWKFADRLASSVFLPGFSAETTPIYSPTYGGSSGASVISHIARLRAEAASAPPPENPVRPRLVRYELVADEPAALAQAAE